MLYTGEIAVEDAVPLIVFTRCYNTVLQADCQHL